VSVPCSPVQPASEGIMDDDKVKCPQSGSEQVHAEKRGWTLQTGAIGSDKIVHHLPEVRSQVRARKTTVTSPMTPIVWVVVGVIALVVLISILSE